MRVLSRSLLAAVLTLTAGCPLPHVQTSGELEYIPAGVASVEEKRSTLTQPQDHPLLSVAAGTVEDDLEDLSGCWGSYAPRDLISPLEADAEFYRFDFETGEMTYQVLQRGPVEGLLAEIALGLDVWVESIYSFEIVNRDRITAQLRTVRSESNAIYPGETSARPPDKADVEGAEPFDLQITLRDDAFKIGDSEGASPEFSAPHRANLVFFRFPCPE